MLVKALSLIHAELGWKGGHPWWWWRWWCYCGWLGEYLQSRVDEIDFEAANQNPHTGDQARERHSLQRISDYSENSFIIWILFILPAASSSSGIADPLNEGALKDDFHLERSDLKFMITMNLAENPFVCFRHFTTIQRRGTLKQSRTNWRNSSRKPIVRGILLTLVLVTFISLLLGLLWPVVWSQGRFVS